jgi:hypothetical protein
VTPRLSPPFEPPPLKLPLSPPRVRHVLTYRCSWATDDEREEIFDEGDD